MTVNESSPERSQDNITVLLVIPTYNNTATLRKIVEEALEIKKDVLVVNDGSTDGGPKTIENLRKISRIDFPKNKGKGAAIRAAAKWAEKHNFTHIITIDADGQHIPRESLRLIEKIKTEPLSIIIGTRDFSNTPVPGSSHFGRKFSNFWMKIATGVSIPDSQSGFRAYPVEMLAQIRCHARRYNFEVEILAKGIWAGLSVDSVPVSVRYTDETKTYSHFRPFLDNMRIAKTYAMLIVRNFFPWPHRILFGVKHGERIRLSLLNPIKAVKTLLSEKTSGKEITLACMLGVFLGTFPLIASHSIAIIFFATRLRLNRVIALSISNLCAPPFVPAMAVEAGYLLRNGHFLVDFNMQTLGYEALQRLGDYLLGAIVLSPILAAVTGLTVFSIVTLYRKFLGKDYEKGRQ